MEVSDNTQLEIFNKNKKLHALINDVFEILKDEPNEIRFIRKNLRPLFIEKWLTNTNRHVYEQMSELVDVPMRVLAEFFDHLQLIWSIELPKIVLAEDSYDEDRTHEETKLIAAEIFENLTIWSIVTDSDIEVLCKFLVTLWNTWLIKNIIGSNLERIDVPRWLFRATSLFDLDFTSFSNISSYTEFLMTNIIEQEKLFGDQYVDMIVENWWLPVDDIEEKETTILSSDKYIATIWSISFNQKEYDIWIRIIPWFSPVWVDFALSMTLPIQGGGVSNENYFSVVWVQFEKRNNWMPVPVIHTVQSSAHNIGITGDWDLVFVKEPYVPENIRLLWSKDRLALFMSCMNLLADKEWLSLLLQSKIHTHWKEYITWLTGKSMKKNTTISSVVDSFLNTSFSPTTVLAWFAVLYFLDKGYQTVEIINPEENLWLMQHNRDRTESSVIKSWKNMYNNMSKILWGSELQNWRHSIDPYSFNKQFVTLDPLSLSCMNIDKLVRSSQEWKNNTWGHVQWISSIELWNDALLDIYVKSEKERLFSKRLSNE